MMREIATCDEDEDVVTMALTVVSRLVEAHGLRYEDVGMLQVGSESLLDRSKSIKSHLMRLFEASGNHNVEGIDNYQACYGGTAALLTCTNWVESEAYDGRWAIAVTTDVSEGTKQYPFFSGAAAAAMLVGPDAPLALEGKRVTHMVHEWDFYKPVGWQSVHPIVDGPHSMQVYFSCLRACQAKMAAAGEGVWVDSHDHLVFHLGSSAKFVKHAFEEAIADAHGDSLDEAEIARASSVWCCLRCSLRSASGRCTRQRRTSTCALCCCTRRRRWALASASSRTARVPRARCTTYACAAPFAWTRRCWRVWMRVCSSLRVSLGRW